MSDLYELFQREGCPYCKRVRSWLAARGVDYVVRQVPKLGAARAAVLPAEATETSVPVLRAGATVIQGSDEILAWLAAQHGAAPFELGDPTYGLTRVMESGDMEAVEAGVTEALKGVGFGVLTRIDVKATLKKKIDVDVPPYVILGACNPPLAHQALTQEPGIGLLLPCNVVVALQPDGRVAVSAIDPAKMVSVVERDDLGEFASEVRGRLASALSAVVVTAGASDAGASQ